MFLLCFSIGFSRKNLQDKLSDTQLIPKHFEASEAKDFLRSIGLTSSSNPRVDLENQDMHHIHIDTGMDSNLVNEEYNSSWPPKVIRGTVAFTFTFPIIKIPIVKTGSKVATINQLDEKKIKGIFISPTKTQEFGISLGQDSEEIGYNQS
ncbi:hypothetical protein AALP_AA1G278700 [Arabis alpina]|uniref:Uncharacterized protein n=1 Tax=Arabis alpina TaxID=50452 RepID=A0A087HR40_ARAAL|nr:hypothetical protein AALP_AA1G278700 [Arabis alpina]